MKMSLHKMGTLVVLMAILLLAAVAPARAQRLPEAVTWPQLLPLSEPWAGTLTYLDYRFRRPVTLPTTLHGRPSGERKLALDFTYQEPNGQSVSGTDTLELSADGRTVIWDGVELRLRHNTVLPGRARQLVLEGEGQDDGKSCRIRKTVVLSRKQLSVRKEVSYADDTTFITRNSYEFETKP